MRKLRKSPWIDTVGFVAKEDVDTLKKYKSEDLKEEHQIHTDLPAQPIVGNVEKSELILLLLNPGFDEADYEEQAKHELFKEQNNLCLQLNEKAYFYLFDDIYHGTAHSRWWHKKMFFEKDERLYKEYFGGEVNYKEFLKEKLLVLEYFPYHSKKWHGSFEKSYLETQKFTFDILRYCMEQGKTIIIMRAKNQWMKAVPELAKYDYYFLKNHQNVFISSGNVLDKEENVKAPNGINMLERVFSDLTNGKAHEKKLLSFNVKSDDTKQLIKKENTSPQIREEKDMRTKVSIDNSFEQVFGKDFQKHLVKEYANFVAKHTNNAIELSATSSYIKLSKLNSKDRFIAIFTKKNEINIEFRTGVFEKDIPEITTYQKNKTRPKEAFQTYVKVKSHEQFEATIPLIDKAWAYNYDKVELKY